MVIVLSIDVYIDRYACVFFIKVRLLDFNVQWWFDTTVFVDNILPIKIFEESVFFDFLSAFLEADSLL
jgi:hypothetical protein